MSASVTDILCTRCGLCCNGSLFGDVELASQREAISIEAMGLEVEDADDVESAALLLQPCAGLKGRRCSIYPHRPKCCRTFECLLLKQVKSGMVSVVAAQRKIDEALRALKQFQKCGGASHPRDAKLEAIRKMFLGP